MKTTQRCPWLDSFLRLYVWTMRGEVSAEWSQLLKDNNGIDRLWVDAINKNNP